MQRVITEYSNEKFNTGIPQIDILQTFSTNDLDWVITDEAGNSLQDEDGNYIVSEKYSLATIDPTSDNAGIKTESDLYINFNTNNPFSEETS